MSNTDAATLARTAGVVRNCYLLIIANAVWLLLPVIGLLTGNNLNMMLGALLVAGASLFLSNNYIGKRWYYSSSEAKNTVFQSHLENIDNIGFITFFVSLISGLAFLISTVFILNIFKSQSGFYMFLAVDIVMSVLLIALAFWVVKHASSGLALAGKSQEFKYEKIANLF